jgi:hypothetical protein
MRIHKRHAYCGSQTPTQIMNQDWYFTVCIMEKQAPYSFFLVAELGFNLANMHNLRINGSPH